MVYPFLPNGPFWVGFWKEKGSQPTKPGFFTGNIFRMLILLGSWRNWSCLADSWVCPLCCSLSPSAPSLSPQEISFLCMGLSSGQVDSLTMAESSFATLGKVPAWHSCLPYRYSKGKKEVFDLTRTPSAVEDHFSKEETETEWNSSSNNLVPDVIAMFPQPCTSTDVHLTCHQHFLME